MEWAFTLALGWEDDIHWMYKNGFDDLKIDLQSEGLKIFNFHPVHVFLNTVDEIHYQQAKPNYQQPAKLKKHENKGSVKGTKDALLDLIEKVDLGKLTTYKLSDINV